VAACVYHKEGMQRRLSRLIALACLALTTAVAADTGAKSPATAVVARDLDGKTYNVFAPAGAAQVLFFVMTDCPISNFYAPEIQRICGDFAARGATCSLVYEDVGPSATVIRKHFSDFKYHNLPALVDADRKIARAAGATVTPEAVVIDHAGRIQYRGRIDNFYADLGKPRRQATTHELRDALDAVVAGKPVGATETKPVGCYIVSPEVLTPEDRKVK
jgi:hypothetical protein